MNKQLFYIQIIIDFFFALKSTAMQKVSQ